MGAGRDEIIGFCDELLAIDRFEDYGPNGLQFPGADEVTTVVSGVSATRELLARAVALGAELVIAHHGLFWDFHPRSVSPQMRSRLALLFEGNISLAGYHLPLDAHPEIGNNALICAGLGLERSEPFAHAKGSPIGWIGRTADPLRLSDLVTRVSTLTARDPLVFDGGRKRIASVGVASGAGSASIHEAVALGLDAFLTGEPAEHVMADAQEGAIHFLAAGHYATETFGIRRLGEVVAEHFGVRHEFVELPNPV